MTRCLVIGALVVELGIVLYVTGLRRGDEPLEKPEGSASLLFFPTAVTKLHGALEARLPRRDTEHPDDDPSSNRPCRIRYDIASPASAVVLAKRMKVQDKPGTCVFLLGQPRTGWRRPGERLPVTELGASRVPSTVPSRAILWSRLTRP